MELMGEVSWLAWVANAPTDGELRVEQGNVLPHVKDLSGLFWAAIDSHFLLRWMI